MRKITATIVAMLCGILAGSTFAVIGAEAASSGYRSVTISKTPCTPENPFGNCFYDAGTMDFGGDYSYWATESDSMYGGAVRRCVRFLDPVKNRASGFCGYFSI